MMERVVVEHEVVYSPRSRNVERVVTRWRDSDGNECRMDIYQPSPALMRRIRREERRQAESSARISTALANRDPRIPVATRLAVIRDFLNELVPSHRGAA